MKRFNDDLIKKIPEMIDSDNLIKKTDTSYI